MHFPVHVSLTSWAAQPYAERRQASGLWERPWPENNDDVGRKHGPHRLVVRTSRRGRDNPGSTPGAVIAAAQLVRHQHVRLQRAIVNHILLP